jgi:thiamine biosynthesis protein ThiS
MQIRINGEHRDVPVGTTVSALLSLLGITLGRVAVEINTRVVTRELHGATELRPEDQVEVVTFVGGG